MAAIRNDKQTYKKRSDLRQSVANPLGVKSHVVDSASGRDFSTARQEDGFYFVFCSSLKTESKEPPRLSASRKKKKNSPI